MKSFIIANWKCNPLTLDEAKNIFYSIEKQIQHGGLSKKQTVELIICPPFQYLTSLKADSPVIRLGAQNCFFEEKGAFTGEISALMLKNIGCEYVIIGHSERRKYQNETDELVNEKIKSALKAGLKPIVCIDQTQQIKKDLAGLSFEEIKKVIVAYEPLFAIGTGKACGIPEAKEMNSGIKSILGNEVPILYGGSVNSENAGGYVKEAGFNGLLVGGASLKPEEFFQIIKNVDLIP